MAIQMTRQQYEQQYGVKPVIATSSVLDDEKPAPLRMTRAEYNALYYPEQKSNPDSLGSKLVNRGKDIVNAVTATGAEAFPGRPLVRVAGAVAGGIADTVGAVVSPILGKAQESLADTSTIQKIASNKTIGKGLDVINKAVDFTSDTWKSFEESNPIISQDIKDVANIVSILPGTRAVKPIVTKADDLIAPIKTKIANKGVENVANEIEKIENKYVKTRNANNYEKDVATSRQRIAESNVLADAVDADGVIRTKGVGGAIDQYKKQTIDEFENIVKLKLDEAKEVMPFVDVKKALIREIGKSGLEGSDLVSALKKIDAELAGLAVRTRGSSVIDLGVLHDAKIATTKNINYLTPPEKRTYRTAVARAYKTLVEKNTKAFDVEEVNKTLSKYYKDIARLERLDGARAQGGRLGKYTASLVGTGIGMAAGSAGGGVGAAIGGVIGGEVGQALKGSALSRTFKGGGKGLAKDPILVKAKLSIPDKPVKVKATITKTKEMKEVESQIAKNVADQKKAIKAGDFTLVQALKEVYQTLVEELKTLIADYKKNGIPLGMSIRKTVTPESVAKKADKQDINFLAKVIDDVESAKTSPEANRILDNMGLGKVDNDELVRFAKDVIDEKDGVVRPALDTPEYKLFQEAKKYKSAEEFVEAINNKGDDSFVTPAVGLKTKTGEPQLIRGFHGTNKQFDKFEIPKDGVRYTGDGVYFSPDSSGATGYGNRVVESYLDLKNPYVLRLPEGNIDFQPGNERIREIIASGHDSIIVRSGKGADDIINEIVVFDLNAIKTKEDIIKLWESANPD